MSASLVHDPGPVHVALVGAPNAGKTTLFNVLTGSSARVGNYPGVTVERREGLLLGASSEVRLLDLPGTYSLIGETPDEQIVEKALACRLAGEPELDGIVCVVDATTLRRGLGLVREVLKRGLPTLLVLTMIDEVRARGGKLDPVRLSRILGIPQHLRLRGNVYLISPDRMMEMGLLTRDDLEPLPAFPGDAVDYHAVIKYKSRLFRTAYGRFTPGGNKGYDQFCDCHKHWLDDFSFFVTLKSHFGGGVWSAWPAELRDRNASAMQKAAKQFADQTGYEKFLQYLFFTHWADLKRYCNERGISFFGDMPIYVDYDSADVWEFPEMFKLDGAKRPTAVAGVPPDYFSETGQRWGNPLYRWEVLKQSGYEWWIRRMAHNLDLFDMVRIDHFRGFVGYWEIPADKKTAIEGTWVEAPAEDFFSVLTARFPDAPIIAEDLGIITPDAKEMMDRLSFPGMKVLLFAFDDEQGANPYLPHNHMENCVLYTGTHDNNTPRGWFTQLDLIGKPAHCGRMSETSRRGNPGPWSATFLVL